MKRHLEFLGSSSGSGSFSIYNRKSCTLTVNVKFKGDCEILVRFSRAMGPNESHPSYKGSNRMTVTEASVYYPPAFNTEASGFR